MGVYTYTDSPLGLSLTPRLETILKSYHSGEDLSQKDIGYLIDESARFTTIRNRIKKRDYKLKDSMLNEEYDIKEAIGDLVEELGYYSATNINEERVYKQELRHFNSYDGSIENLGLEGIKLEIRRALIMIKELQKGFDDNEDNLKAVGTFVNLKKEYNFKLEVTSGTLLEDVLKEIVTQILPKVQDEANKKQRMVDRLNELSETVK